MRLNYLYNITENFIVTFWEILYMRSPVKFQQFLVCTFLIEKLHTAYISSHSTVHIVVVIETAWKPTTVNLSAGQRKCDVYATVPLYSSTVVYCGSKGVTWRLWRQLVHHGLVWCAFGWIVVCWWQLFRTFQVNSVSLSVIGSVALCVQCIVVHHIDAVQATLLWHDEGQLDAAESERAYVVQSSFRP